MHMQSDRDWLPATDAPGTWGWPEHCCTWCYRAAPCPCASYSGWRWLPSARRTYSITDCTVAIETKKKRSNR